MISLPSLRAWAHVLRFEVGSHLRDFPLYITSAVLFVYWFFATLRMKHDPNFWGMEGEVHYNAPVVIYFLFAAQAFVQLAIVPIFMARPLLRDSEHKTIEVVHALPIEPGVLFWARFVGAFVPLLLAVSVASTALLIGPHAAAAFGLVPPERVVGVPIGPLVSAWLILPAPTLLAASSVVYAAVALTRRYTAALVATLLLALGAVVAHQLRGTVDSTALEFFDLTGFQAVHVRCEYWTVAERNAKALPLEGALLINPGLCLVLAALALGVARLGYRGRRRVLDPSRRNAATPPSWVANLPVDDNARATLRSPLMGRMAEFRKLLEWEHREVLTDPVLWLALFICLVWAAAQSWVALHVRQDTLLPLTSLMVEARRGLWMLTFILIPFVAASVLHRERSYGAHELIAVLPVSWASAFVSKLAATTTVATLVTATVVAAGLAVQLASGWYRVEPGVYASVIGGVYFPYLLQLVTFSVGVGALAVGRAKSFGLIVLVLYATVFAVEAGTLEHGLTRQMYETRHVYSAFDGFGPESAKVVAYGIYWLSLAGGMAALGAALWSMGVETGVRPRLRVAWQRLRGGGWLVATGFWTIACVAGIWLWRQHNMARQDDNMERRAVSYERRYAYLRSTRVPRIEMVDARVRIDPDRQRASADLDLTLYNPHSESIHDLNLGLPWSVTVNDLRINGSAVDAKERDEELGQARYSLRPPLREGESRSVSIDISVERRGFTETARAGEAVTRNGTFLSRILLPCLGYDRSREIDVPYDRMRLGLPSRRPAFRPLEEVGGPRRPQGCGAEARRWRFAVEVPPGQKAVAPGTLVHHRSMAHGEEYVYASDREAAQAATVAAMVTAANYAEHRRTWSHGNSSPITIEVMTLPEHAINASTVLDATEFALTELSSRFGAFPASELRIVEVPAFAGETTRYANVIILPEDEVWNGDYRDGQGNDYAYYTIARQLASFWWCDRLRPDPVVGADVLCRGLPEYLALSLVEARFGRSAVQERYVTRLRNHYFWYHGIHGHRESPLLRSDDNPFVTEIKAGLAFRHLAHVVGPPLLAQVLTGYYAARVEGPRETSAVTLDALYRDLREAFSQQNELLEELFERVVWYRNRILDASAMPRDDGTYRVRIQIEIAPHGAGLSRAPGQKSGLRVLTEAGAHDQTISLRPGEQTVEWIVEGRPLEVLLDPDDVLLEETITQTRRRVRIVDPG